MSELNNNNTDRKVKRMPSATTLLGVAFGIFMVLLYVGMGIALLTDFFGWGNQSWGWMRWIVGPVLIIYGFYRGYRQYNMFTHPDY